MYRMLLYMQEAHQTRASEPLSQAPDKLQDLWLYLEPLLDAQQHGRLKAHFDAYKVIASPSSGQNSFEHPNQLLQ